MSSSLLRTVSTLFYRDILLATRQAMSIVNPLVFYAIVVSLFPLAVSSDPVLLHQLAPGMVWIAALLANLLALERFLISDFADGSLEQFILLPQPLVVPMMAKLWAHIVLVNTPLLLFTPLLGLQLHLTGAEIALLMVSLMLGLPVISCLGGIAVALTVNVRAGGVLLALLVLPLAVPVLIFGVGSVVAVQAGVSAVGLLLILSALLVLALTLTPFAMAAAVRIGLA